MSNISNKPLVDEINKRSVEERRYRQQEYLNKWDAGKITPRQCIECIIDLEKMIYIGDNIKSIRRSKQ